MWFTVNGSNPVSGVQNIVIGISKDPYPVFVSSNYWPSTASVSTTGGTMLSWSSHRTFDMNWEHLVDRSAFLIRTKAVHL